MKVTIFTDGAARGNPDGPGGYGAVIRYQDKSGTVYEKELSGGFPKTTNNRMELMGVIAALEEIGTLGESCRGLVYSDSRYVVDAFEKNWIRSWQKNGWITSSKTPVKNQDLWMRLLRALEPHDIHFRWVKGHADMPENERCDKLATGAADKVGWGFGSDGTPFRSASAWIPVDDKEAALRDTGKASAKTISAKAVISPEEMESGPGGHLRASGNRISAKASGLDPPEKIRIRYLSDRIDHLQPPTNSANWVDLRCAEDVTLHKGEFRLIRLGVAMKLPEGYEAHVVPRSSTYKNFGIIQANHHGVIDNTYCGDEDEWRMPVIALRDTEIHVNDRICQFRIERRQPDIIFEEVDHLGEAGRGGFGSTGIQ